MTTQRKERKKDISLYWSKLQVLQFYKFLMNSRIKDGVWYKLSCLKKLIFKSLISVSCICFLNKFLLTDFLIFSGKAFHSLTPNRSSWHGFETEFCLAARQRLQGSMFIDQSITFIVRHREHFIYVLMSI